MALQRRWNSWHSSMLMTPFMGGGPCHTYKGRAGTSLQPAANLDKNLKQGCFVKE